jgi:hypothetical protein
MFCAPGSVFVGTEWVGSSFNVLCSLTHFQRYRGCRVMISFFALLDSFSCSVLPDQFSASGPIFMFYALGLIFGCIEGVGSRFHVLRSRTGFQRNRGRRVPFSCFTLWDSFLAVSRASGPAFMFCALGPVFKGTEGVGSCFHVFRSRSYFRRNRARRIPFSCFALPDPLLSEPRGSGPIFLLCSPGLIY